MDYRERLAPDELRPLVKLAWTLSVPADGPDWLTHDAVPDGCMEIIRRLSGHSAWEGDQPETFVAGLLTHPAELRLRAGSRFVALRIWPWTWRLISGRSPRDLADRWGRLDEEAPDFRMPKTVTAAFGSMRSLVATPIMRSLIAALPAARTAGDLADMIGLSPRALQRWFKTNVGQAPQSYLRILRFGGAFAELPSANGGLAGHAADHGFADQAHMAREFRSLAGSSAGQARQSARGPFIERP